MAKIDHVTIFIFQHFSYTFVSATRVVAGSRDATIQ